MLYIPEVTHVWYYKAPYGCNPQPRVIPEGQQDIEVIISGRGFYEEEDRLKEAIPGTILWHRPSEKTIYMNDFENPYECIVITIHSSESFNVRPVSRWTDKFSLQVFIDNILTEYHSESKDMNKLAYYVFGQLYWHCRETSHTSPLKSKRSEEMQRVIDWIDNHFSEDITISKLAEIADLSVPHLHVVFKESVHQTPYQFIQTKRILEAKKLLATTRLSVKEVCAKTGFNDMGNFCRLFRKLHDLTAQEYRLLHTDKR